MEDIRDDELVSAERFRAYYKAMGWRTQTEAAEALGVTQAYISNLKSGVYNAQPGTSLHKLLQALQREQALLRRLARNTSSDEKPAR